MIKIIKHDTGFKHKTTTVHGRKVNLQDRTSNLAGA